MDAWRPAPEPTHCDLVLACAQPGMADLDGNYFTEDDCIVENQCLRDDNPCDANASCADPDFANENPAWEICECNRADGYVGDGASCELPGPAQSVVDHAHLPAEGGTLTARGVQDGLADEGARVTFAATPAEKYYVSGWTGAGCAADGETGQARSPGAAKECEMLVGEANVFVTVNFAAAREVVFGGALASLGGASIRSGAHVEDGATITFHAEIPENNRVSGWTNNGATVGLCGDNRMCEVAADDDVNVLARFSPVQRLVDYSHSPGIGGTLRAHVIGGGTVDHGTTVTFTAIPAEGYDVSGWSDSECGAVGLARTPGIEKECELIAESDVYVTVTFAIARKVEFGGALASLGGESIDSGAYAADGATITFYAEIPENHEVSEWTNNGAAVESCGGNRICEVAADDDVNVLARFSPVQRLVDYSHSPGAGGTLRALVIGGGTVDHGTTVTFTAIPADDFYVHSWTGSGAECSGGQCVLTATMALFVTVHFGRDQCASMECGANTECRDENHLTADDAANLCSCAPDYTLVEGGGCQATQYATGRPSAAVFENGIVSLSWTAPAEPVSGYVILRQTVASGIYASLTVAADLSYVDEDAPPGATVRYKIQAEVAGVNTPESQESPALTIPPAADCRAMNRAPGSRPQFCDRGCMTLEGAQFMQLEPGGACLHWLRDDFGGMPQADVCLALRRKNDQILEGAEKRVCSGIDKIDTFCILDSTDAFPCRGLFKHVLQCNLEHNRPAEDMFFCGPKCPPGQNAVGAECRE